MCSWKRMLALAALVGAVSITLAILRPRADARPDSVEQNDQESLAAVLMGGAMLNQWTDMPTNVLLLVPDHYNPCDVLAVGELVGIRHITSHGFPHPLGTRYGGGHWQFDVALTQPAYYSPSMCELFRGHRHITINSLVLGDNDTHCVQQRVVAFADFNQHDGELWGNVVTYKPK